MSPALNEAVVEVAAETVAAAIVVEHEAAAAAVEVEAVVLYAAAVAAVPERVAAGLSAPVAVVAPRFDRVPALVGLEHALVVVRRLVQVAHPFSRVQVSTLSRGRI